MSSTDTPSLGPQCLSCKRRRVKCDFSTPSCQRCERDSITCPGYKKALRWRSYKPKHDRTIRTEQQLSIIVFPENTTIRETRILHHSSQYYNTYLLPEIVPAYLPFKRDDQAAREWDTAPLVLRHLMVLLVKSAQSRQGACESSSELYHYRARTLEDLRRSLSEAVEDPYGIALSAVILLMGVELQYPEFGSWTWLYHFNAAKRIVRLRGGYGQCFFGLPHSQGMLLKLMMVDTFSMTLCNRGEMEEDSVQLQLKYLPIMLLREQTLVESGHLCPQPLLRCIILTTILRAQSQMPRKSALGGTEPCQSYDRILTDILAFDALHWSEKVALYGLIRPLRVEDAPTSLDEETWHALALAYQYAAQIYLFASVQAPTTLHEHDQLIELQKCLAQQIDYLFHVANRDPDAPIPTQCWKFALWPATVSVVIDIGWCSEGFEQMDQKWQRLQLIAETLGSSSLLKASCFARNVADRRAVHLEATWSWDDVFSTRCAFVAC